MGSPTPILHEIKEAHQDEEQKFSIQPLLDTVGA